VLLLIQFVTEYFLCILTLLIPGILEFCHVWPDDGFDRKPKYVTSLSFKASCVN
jgi:hypothetical protein